MNPSDEFKSRAPGKTLLLSPVHHQAMDFLLSELNTPFSREDAIQVLERNEAIVDHPAIERNPQRVKLVLTRVLEGLLTTGMITSSPMEPERYVIVWKNP